MLAYLDSLAAQRAAKDSGGLDQCTFETSVVTESSAMQNQTITNSSFKESRNPISTGQKPDATAATLAAGGSALSRTNETDDR